MDKFAKWVLIINILWQGWFLFGAIQMYLMVTRFYGLKLSFGYLWPTALWTLGIITNIWYLKAKDKKLWVSILLGAVPAIVANLIGNYYQMKAIESIMDQIDLIQE